MLKTKFAVVSWHCAVHLLFVLLCKAFLVPLCTYALPEWFSFFSANKFTNLERLHQAGSRAINACFSFSPIPPLLTEAFLPSSRVILTHFAMSSYERDFCFPTFVPISDLARLAVKPKLSRFSWRAFASTYLLILSPKEVLFAYSCPSSSNPISFTVKSTFS